jgi:hypothetical protein
MTRKILVQPEPSVTRPANYFIVKTVTATVVKIRI